MRTPRVICTADGLEMTITKTAETVEIFTKDGEPYSKVAGDQFACTNCNAAVTLLAPEPIAGARDAGYDSITATRKADLIG